MADAVLFIYFIYRVIFDVYVGSFPICLAAFYVYRKLVNVMSDLQFAVLE